MQPSAIRRTIGLPVGILATLVLALAACTSSSPAASTGGEPSTATSQSTAPGSSTAPASSTGTGPAVVACELATKDEVGTAYGFTVAVADPTADENYSYCTYAQAGDVPANVLTYVSLSEAALAIYEGYKAEADETVSGVGDEAFWASDVLYLKKGNAFAAISTAPSRPGSADPREAAVALGKIIAGNM